MRTWDKGNDSRIATTPLADSLRDRKLNMSSVLRGSDMTTYLSYQSVEVAPEFGTG
jgi:hypothetical protein